MKFEDIIDTIEFRLFIKNNTIANRESNLTVCRKKNGDVLYILYDGFMFNPSNKR